MNKKYMAVSMVALFVAAILIIYAVKESRVVTENAIAAAQQKINALSTIESRHSLQSVNPAAANSGVNQGLSVARAELNRVAAEVSQLKGSVAGQIQNLGPALNSIREVQGTISNLQNSSNEMLALNQEFVQQLSEVQSEYETKINELEISLSTLKASARPSYGLEFYVGLAGLITSISSLLLGWRKDSREAEKLKLEITELKSKNVSD